MRKCSISISLQTLLFLPTPSFRQPSWSLLWLSFLCSDLGAHVDGYVALVATTVIVGETAVTGKKADAIQAAKVASDAIIRLLQPGKKNSELTPLIEKVWPRCLEGA